MTPAIDKLLFSAASSFTGREERRAFLEFACQGDELRLQRIEELLEYQRDADDYFELQPHVGNAAPSGEDGMEEGVAGLRIGRYRLIDRLGSGGCGVVYLAEQQEPVKRKVALKIIRLGMNTESVIARFASERRALSMMDHPNIARVLDAGSTASGFPYFVMELVDGEKITDFCDNHRLDLRQRLKLFILVCDAIQHAHQKGVIHRDIKPSNVLVRHHDGRPEPKVIDFGIAKAAVGDSDADATITQCGQLIGTPAYMSPEQAQGGMDVDTRSDIYSLGALLCELLTGSPPLKVEHSHELGVEGIRSLLREGETSMPSNRVRAIPRSEVVKIASRRSADPQRLPSMLAGDLDWIVMKAVENDRQRRYETANALALDVQRHLREEPVLARPPSRRYLLGKMIRRNRVTFAAASIAVAGLLGGFGVSTWLFLRERDARQEQARLRVIAEQARATEVRLRQAAKAVDQVAQAAVLLRYDEKDQADKLLDAIPAAQVPHSLEAAETLTKVANWNLKQGQWQAAAKRFNSLGHVLTSVDMSDWEGISFQLLSAATAVSKWGEPEQYEHLRSLMIGRFANSANPIVAEHIIKASLLEPASTETLNGLLPLADVIGKSLAAPDAEKDPHMVAWRQFSLALMAYRQGRLEDAAEWARRSIATASNSEERRDSNRLVLAMIAIREGRHADAEATLKQLRTKMDRWINAPFQINNPDGTLWYNQGTVVVLLEEAERMAREIPD
jgi:serine/threonine protein kinase